MKKFLSIFIAVISILSIFLFGCTKVNPLISAVSELRCDLFEGSGEHFNLKACYGFKETPFNNDAKVSEKVYALTFRLSDKETDGATYTVSLYFDEKNYKADFKLNPVTDCVTAFIEIDGFNQKEFAVTVSSGGTSENIILSSIVPDGTIDYKTALDYLLSNQSELIKVYTDNDGNFNAEIYARIVVKNGAPYWYVGIASGEGNLKALLIDGFTGETLAIREIF